MSQTPSPTERAWADGIAIFAGAALITIGFFQVLQSIAAISKDSVFAVTDNFVFEFDLTTWGWIHLLLGVALIVIGGALLAGQPWALIAGIVVAILSALANFVWLPYYPLWAIVVIAFDLAAIWALSTLWGSRNRG